MTLDPALLAGLESASAILFNVLAAAAAVAAAIRYFVVTKALTAHTLLGISWSPVLWRDDARLIELVFDVQNQSVEAFRFYNLFVRVSAVRLADGDASSTADGCAVQEEIVLDWRNLIEEREEWVRLSPGRDYQVSLPVRLGGAVEAIRVDMVVPYRRKRIPTHDGSIAGLTAGDEYNSLTRHFDVRPSARAVSRGTPPARA
ncbi:MAG: hypothetical protein RLO51_27180 [Thalassobaculum sp.]|uniref:hypothetical protein n=1 Tax=Thalassobaculum sp. TaxID=2022740 RepID=UPI0032EB5E8C